MKYRIKAGDALSRIATAHGLSLAALLDANPQYKTTPDRIRVGEELEIPERQPATAPPVRLPAVRKLGNLSAKYETGNRGPGTVSTGVGDAGGVSYGSYQMTSRNGGTVARFVAQPDFPWRQAFQNLAPGSSAFTAQWKEIAAAHAEAFHDAQHAYMKKTHFDPLVERIKNESSLDITTRSQALQDGIWSTAVQHGPNTPVVHRALTTLQSGGPLDFTATDFDRRLIMAIYADRGRTDANGTLVYFARNSAAVQQGVAQRFVDEERDALQMLTQEAQS